MSCYTSIKRNDTRPKFSATLRDGRGNSINLTGATACRFYMRNRATRALKVDQPATITYPSTGQVEYSWAAGDTDTSGVYDVEIQVTYSDGTVETFPNDGYHELRVLEDLA